ncbi:MAG: AI-2E family transporter, partial [Anaerolineales bacterium]|nr:AI-2E family transporter [Anaerolineales bacterium]
MPELPEFNESPTWNAPTKIIVVLVALILFALITYRFQSLIGLLSIAAMMAYLMHPIISFIDKRTPIKRSTVVLVAYLLLLVLLMGAMAALGVAAYNQVVALIEAVPDLITALAQQIDTLSQQTISIGSFSYDMAELLAGYDVNSLADQLLGLIQPAISQGSSLVGSVATTTLAILGNFFFIFVISIYIANDIPRLGGIIGDFAQQPGYRKDAERITREFGRIWNAYLRGQVILGLVIGIVVGVSLAILGVENALALGILSGLLEFVPVIGPVIGAGAAMLVAFFQPMNYMGLAPWQFSLVVLLVMFLIQQLENNILVPRIVGDALELHPLIVMVAVFMGANLAGIMGAILAAPLFASAKLLGVYTWRKLFDLEPFAEPERDRPQALVSSVTRRSRELVDRVTGPTPRKVTSFPPLAEESAAEPEAP